MRLRLKSFSAAAVVGVAVSLAASTPVRAEIEKTATLDCQGICLHAWPKLTIPPGWVRDLASSQDQNLNFLRPKGAGRSDYRVFIYGNALSTEKQAPTLEAFIADDKASSAKKTPNIVITETDPIKAASGESLRTFTFDPKGEGRWEFAAYGEETDADNKHYYLVFVLSAETQAIRDKNLSVFKSMLSAYR